MKNILRTIISRAAVIKSMFIACPKRQERKLRLRLTRLKPDDLYTNKIFCVLKGDLNYPAPFYRSELKMLHRRLVQYQRLRRYGGSQEQEAALRKLEKEWNRFQRNHLRKIKSTNPAHRGTRKIIPMSFNGGFDKLNPRGMH